MTSTALTIFDPANVPDHILRFNEQHSNIGDKMSVDSLTYQGRVWTVNISGSKTPLMKTNDEGDQEPRQSIPIIVLDYNKRRGRSYYADGFQQDKPQMPTCWSPDGIEPDKSSIKLQADKCANCKLSAKGSKTTEQGSQTTACSQYRMVAVQLYKKWDTPPLRLRLAITSDYDGRNKENENNGWFGFQQLIDLLRARGVKHTGSAVIRAKFDMSVPYPKVVFSPVGWITEDEEAIIAPLSEGDAVKQLLSITYTPNGADNTHVEQAMPQDEGEPELVGPTPPAEPAKRGRKPAQVAAPVEITTNEEGETYADEEPPEEIGNGVAGIVAEAEEDEEDPEVAAARAAEEARKKALEKQQEKAAKAAAARKAAAKDEDDEITIGAPIKPAATAAKAAQAPAKPVASNGAAKAAQAPTKAAATAGKAPGKTISPAVANTLQSWQDD